MKTLNNWKLWLPDVLVVVIFALISFAYFFPADIEGRILYQHDASAGRGAGQEASEYYERTGERTRWTNALFSGMPTYQTAPSYNSTAVLSQAVKAYHLWLPENVWYVFVYLLGFYILLRAFNFRQWLAALEGDGVGISAADDWRNGACLSRQIPVGLHRDGYICRL